MADPCRPGRTGTAGSFSAVAPTEVSLSSNTDGGESLQGARDRIGVKE